MERERHTDREGGCWSERLNESARKRVETEREKERKGERMKIKGWLNWAQISKVNFVRKLQWPDKSVPVNEFCCLDYS